MASEHELSRIADNLHKVFSRRWYNEYLDLRLQLLEKASSTICAEEIVSVIEDLDYEDKIDKQDAIVIFKSLLRCVTPEQFKQHLNRLKNKELNYYFGKYWSK